MTGVQPVEVERALASYYDQEGDDRLRRPIDPRRLAGRDAFIGRLTGGSSERILELGPGPGRDAVAFIEAGHRHVAVDLSFEHARRCQATGTLVGLASARALPFPTATFDAVWTMSVLMHVPDSAIGAALAELSRVLKPGGRAAIGVWGGPDIESHGDGDPKKRRPARFFSRRSDDRWQSMLATIGTVDEFEAWPGEDDFHYQWATLRNRSN
jgi:SAM-dependent methyltransferase